MMGRRENEKAGKRENHFPIGLSYTASATPDVAER